MPNQRGPGRTRRPTGTVPTDGITLQPRPQWHLDANCHPTHRPTHITPKQWVDIWYPPETGGGRDVGPNHGSAARPYCDTCPAANQCREAGLGEQYGIWAGSTSQDRIRERRRRRNQGGPR